MVEVLSFFFGVLAAAAKYETCVCRNELHKQFLSSMYCTRYTHLLVFVSFSKMYLIIHC